MLRFYRNTVLPALMKLVGMEPTALEIEPGTVMKFWVPTTKKAKKPLAGDKPAVVLLHGFAADGILTWQFQVLSLAKKYSVYVPDFIFFGGSTTGRPDRSVEFQAECIAKGLSRLGVSRCTVIGLSYGGMVGFKMAHLYPDLVRSMVVTCSVMALTESVSHAGLQRIGFSSWPDYLLPDSVDGVRVLFDVASDRFRKLPRFVCKDVLENLFENRMNKTELLEALVVRDEISTVNHYQQRICLLWGENDRIFDMETARNLKEQIGEKAMLDYIEGAGHLVPLERPLKYNRKLKSILASFEQDEK